MREENDINNLTDMEYIDKFISIKMKNTKTLESGIVLDVCKEWILVRSLFSDYILDGYKLINKNYIKSIKRDDSEIFTEEILRVSGKYDFKEINIPLETSHLFHYLYEEEIVFEVTLKDTSVCYIGKITKLSEKSFYFKPINSKGIWEDYKYMFRMKFIRVISLDTDYINSLLAYNKTLAE